MFERVLEVVPSPPPPSSDGDRPASPVSIRVLQESEGAEAVVVWDAALVLAYFVQHHRHALGLHHSDHSPKSRRLRVVELGSGTGAVGLVAAALGADVLLTDVEEYVPLLKKNVGLNAALFPGRVEARRLRWGDVADLSAVPRPVDVVLVSDCVYYDASVEPLVDTLKVLSADADADTRILVSYEDRPSPDKVAVQARFAALVERDFDVVRHPLSDCHPDYASDDIHVLTLRRKVPARHE